MQGATTRVAENIGLLRSIRCYIAPARAPTPLVTCSDRGATVQFERMAEDVWTRWCVFSPWWLAPRLTLALKQVTPYGLARRVTCCAGCLAHRALKHSDLGPVPSTASHVWFSLQSANSA